MNTSLVIRSLLLAALSLPVVFSPQIHAAETATAEVSDVELAAKVKTALDADPELRQLKLTVKSKNKEVTIDGKMSDDQQMLKAGLIAEKVPGVKYVINNMMMN